MLKVVRILVLIISLCIAGLGLLGGALGMVFGLTGSGLERLTTVAFSASFFVLAAGLGLAMAWQSWQAIQERGSGPFRLKRLWLWVLVYVLALIAGQLVLSLDLLPPLFFPAFYVAAAALPPLILLGLVAWALPQRTRWRDIVLEIGSGSFLSTTLAFSLEIAFVLGLVLALIAVVAMQPAGPEMIEMLADRMEDPAWLQDPAGLGAIPMSPWLAAAVLLVFAVAIPVIEEGVKTLGVGLLSYRRPTMDQAFLWGIASGAGFALAENLFNTTSGLGLWAPAALVRVGATLLHCFTGGLMGLAWYFLLAERRWGRALGLYAGSVAVHSAWNAMAAGMVLLSLGSLDAALTESTYVLTGLGVVALVGLMLLVGVGVTLGFAGLTLYVRKRTQVIEVPQLVEPEPILVAASGEGVAQDGQQMDGAGEV